MDIRLILILSVLIQFSCTVLALMMIRRTGPHFSIIAIAFALFGMGLRRLIPLYRNFRDPSWSPDYQAEVVALLLSAVMLLGIIGVNALVLRWQRNRKENERLIEEKELILREVHHRIKNNMTTVISLLELKKSTTENEDAIMVLTDAVNRLQSMTVLYEKVYRIGNYRDMPTREYLEMLTTEVIASFPGSSRVRLETDIESFSLPIDRMYRVGILICEIVTNSMKYAFEGKSSGRILFSMKKEGDRVSLVIADDGCGMGAAKADTATGFGLVLIQTLVEQLAGTLRYETDGGTRISITFPA